MISHTWIADVDQPVNYILIHLYTGTIVPNFYVAAKNIEGSFTIIESTRPEPFDKNNFDDFILGNDNPYAYSSNDSTNIFLALMAQ